MKSALTYGLSRGLSISDLFKAIDIQDLPTPESVGLAYYRKSQLFGEPVAGLRLQLPVHSVKHLGARLFCFGLCIGGAIQVLKSHAGLLHEQCSCSLSLLIHAHLRVSGMKKKWDWVDHQIFLVTWMQKTSFHHILRNGGKDWRTMTGCEWGHKSYRCGH